MIHARDASGRQVSLLNDESNSHAAAPQPQRLSYSVASHVVSQPFSSQTTRSASSSPNTPALLRSASYDSQISNEPLSPMTPNIMYTDYARPVLYSSDLRSPYEEAELNGYTTSKRPGVFAISRSTSYEDDVVSPPATNSSDRIGKRYPCRYRESHGCEKTFTTSGHASRHSKIHTAEKAVQCSFAGCSKKFTRADNMKQHLETHYKDKSRSTGARPGAGRRHSSAKAATLKRLDSMTSPPLSGTAWDLRELDLPVLLTRPSATRTPSSGLDALAMAVACQEGA